MVSGFFSFFRSARPRATDTDAVAPASSASPSLSPPPPPPPPLLAPDRRTGTKRRTSPPASDRSAAAVKRRWKQLEKERLVGRRNKWSRTQKQPATIAAQRPSSSYASWFSPLRFIKSEPVECPSLPEIGAATGENVHQTVHMVQAVQTADTANSSASSFINADTVVVNTSPITTGVCDLLDTAETASSASASAGSGAGAEASASEDEGEYDDEDSSLDELSGYGTSFFPTPLPAQGPRLGSLTANLASLAAGSEPTASTEGAYSQEGDDYSEDEGEEDEVDDYEDEEEGADLWAGLFEQEPATGERYLGAETTAETTETESEWEVDEDELKGYETEVEAIAGFPSWTHDEKRLHRLMSLRGFHPLMPAIWSRDFLGVPMYPSLFAPPDRPGKPTLICNKSSQFRATKALRSLFDLQVRVSGLRQAGNTRRIDAIIEKELRRYIAWAAEDAGLDRCAPLAAMPNVTAKRFSKDGERRRRPRPGKPTTPLLQRGESGRRRKRTLARRIQDYFRDWAAQYREYYANLPPFAERDEAAAAAAAAAGGDAIKEEEDDDDDNVNDDKKGESDDRSSSRSKSKSRTLRRLRPPRLLYGFVIVQHVVMLLAVDAARPRARPRCFADFNMSLGGHWLDASLSVAIPVHLARAAQLRAARGLALPRRLDADEDEDV